MNEHAEPTEMAGVAEAETQAAYAWALDYDGDELPTVPTQRLTPWRITSLALASSLVVIAVAGAVALGVLHQPEPAPASAPVVIEAVAQPAPPPPAPTVTATVTAPVADHDREESFMAALNGGGPNRIPYATIPGSHGAYMGDVAAWTVGGPVVKYGYQACAVLNRYPNDIERATVVFFEEELGADPPTSAGAGWVEKEMQWRKTYMRIAGTYLC